MPIDIIGPGAIGLHVALSLDPSTPVRLRHPNAKAGQTDTIEDDRGRRRQVEWHGFSARSPRIQQAIVTTKAYQVVDALTAMLPCLSDPSEVLLLHNGLGPQEQAACLLPTGARLLAGATTEGALRITPGQIRHTGTGTTWLGPWAAPAPPGGLARALVASGLNALWEASPARVRQRLWEKLIINCAINPLTALENRPNGELAQPALRSQWVSLVAEATQIARLEGIALDPNTMTDQVDTVISGTAHNYSSMHQDLRHGRPTEAPQILGTLIEKADAHELAVPSLRSLWQRLSCK